MDQAVALKSQEEYKKLKFAFRYRKEVVNGCSCKAAEYVPADGSAATKAENAPANAPAQPTDAATAAARALAAQSAAPPRQTNTDGWQTQAQP
jgi:hypothetical protein